MAAILRRPRTLDQRSHAVAAGAIITNANRRALRPGDVTAENQVAIS